MFIYIITNDVNDLAYVGYHTGDNLYDRWYGHLYDARKGDNRYLYRAMRSHGIEKFHIIPVWSGHVTVEELKQLEIYYIKCFKTKQPYGYNLTDGGDGTDSEFMKNLWKDPEYRAKMDARPRFNSGQFQSGQTVSVATIAKQNAGKAEYWNSLSEEEMKAWSEQTTQNNIEMWANRTEEDRVEIGKKISAAQLAQPKEERSRRSVAGGQASYGAHPEQASANTKKFWVELRKDPIKLKEYLTNRSKKIAEAKAKKKALKEAEKLLQSNNQ